VVVTNVHLRFEDTTIETTPVPLALGVTIRQATMVPYAKRDKARHPDDLDRSSPDPPPWGSIPANCEDPTLVDKFMAVEGLAVYCDSDNMFSLMTEEVRRGDRGT
jgi:hypothetical protein